uniref:2S albumin n=1 Tax=Bertholletia excelsa TaxID=3645 RepID=B6EU55_BEREX|nr:2S albumin precursor [Bertholletia excelsa]prf//1905414A albumin 2S [Bertholletia excelsa]
MAKISVAAAALLVLMALGHATAFRATVTTTVVEEENQEECREQMQRQQMLSHCRMYMRQQMEESPYQTMPRRGMEPHMSECCEQLEGMDESCRCEGLRRMMRMMQQKEMQPRGEQMRRMMRLAENIPSRCNLSPMRCPMGGSIAGF